jgi:hypothetical protein
MDAISNRANAAYRASKQAEKDMDAELRRVKMQ